MVQAMYIFDLSFFFYIELGILLIGNLRPIHFDRLIMIKYVSELNN